MSEANKPTTPEKVLSAIGELIVCKTKLGGLIVCNAEQGYNMDELVTLLAAYTKLLKVMPKPAPIIRKEEVQ